MQNNIPFNPEWSPVFRQVKRVRKIERALKDQKAVEKIAKKRKSARSKKMEAKFKDQVHLLMQGCIKALHGEVPTNI